MTLSLMKKMIPQAQDTVLKAKKRLKIGNMNIMLQNAAVSRQDLFAAQRKIQSRPATTAPRINRSSIRP
jgi:hypothetical protein